MGAHSGLDVARGEVDGKHLSLELVHDQDSHQSLAFVSYSLGTISRHIL